jgi:inorganic pyrophosphatase/exopolyphosphatase
VRADQKNFTFDGQRVGFATLEVNDSQAVLALAVNLIIELRLLKKDKKLDFTFLSVVDLGK